MGMRGRQLQRRMSNARAALNRPKLNRTPITTDHDKGQGMRELEMTRADPPPRHHAEIVSMEITDADRNRVEAFRAFCKSCGWCSQPYLDYKRADDEAIAHMDATAGAV